MITTLFYITRPYHMRIDGSKYDLYHNFVKILSNNQKRVIWARLEGSRFHVPGSQVRKRLMVVG